MDNSEFLLETAIENLSRLIKESKYCVLYTGAGISTASGLPDYRGPNGILTLKEQGISYNSGGKPWSTYEPNNGHYAITELINHDYVKFLISQNVDGLHVKAGAPFTKIAELHGNSTLMRCMYCRSIHSIEELGWERSTHGMGRLKDDPHPQAPVCLSCGGRVVSTVVYFGDPLPSEELQRARTESIKSDLFIVLGSSLTVSPAASFPKIAKKHGAKVIIVNKGETKKDSIAEEKYDLDVSILISKIAKRLII